MEHKMVNCSKPQLLISDWIEQFVANIPYLKSCSRQMYRHVVLDFVRHIEKSSGKENFFSVVLKQGLIAGWLKEMSVKFSKHTVVWRAGILTHFFDFLEKRGCLGKNPLGQLQKKYPKKGLKGIVLALVGTSPQKSLQALERSPRFASFLGDQMQKFISLGRAQGKIYKETERFLCQFDRFLISYPYPPSKLSDSILKKWLSMFAKCSSSHQYESFYIVRRFCL